MKSLIRTRLVLSLCLLQIPLISAMLEKDSVKWGLSERQGKRKTMEDAYTVRSLRLAPYESDASYFGLFDGHGGALAAQYAARFAGVSFAALLKEAIKLGVSPDDAIRSAFKELYSVLDNEIQRKFLRDGTTALSALLIGKELYVSWAGDTRLIVINKEGKLKVATEDHIPLRPTEFQRIEDKARLTKTCIVVQRSLFGEIYRQEQVSSKYGETLTLQAGQEVYHDGPWRLGGLSMSRSLGDRTLKKNEPLILAQPEVIKVSVEPGDIVVLGCDGVWDVLSNESVASLITYQNKFDISELQIVHEAPKTTRQEKFMKEAGSDEKLTILSRIVRDKAYGKGSSDNISVLMFQVP